MQYYKDIDSKDAKIFKTIRDILLSNPEIKEIKREKQTSYYDDYGVVAMLRPKDNIYIISFGRGAKMQKKFPMLKGSGKVVRHLYIESKVDKKLVKELIKESLILGVEQHELRK